MSVFEIIISIILLLTGIATIFLFMHHESKDDGMTSAISGGYDGSFANTHSRGGKQQKIDKAFAIFSVIYCVIAIGTIIFMKFGGISA